MAGTATTAEARREETSRDLRLSNGANAGGNSESLRGEIAVGEPIVGRGKSSSRCASKARVTMGEATATQF